MRIEYTGKEIWCVSWHASFAPNEVREVADDEGLYLLRSPLFRVVEKKTEEKEESKTSKKITK